MMVRYFFFSFLLSFSLMYWEGSSPSGFLCRMGMRERGTEGYVGMWKREKRFG